MHDMLKKKKNMQRKSKEKRIKMLLNIVASMFLGDVGVIRWMYFEGDSPLQAAMIVCVCM